MRILSFVIFTVLIAISRSGDRQETVRPHNPLKETPVKTTSADGDSKSDYEPLETGGLEWMNMDQLAKIPLSGSKFYLIDVYTEWCGWCKVMDKKTFSDTEVQGYLKKNFHLIKFDAERNESVSFKNKIYNWVEGGKRGHNELALELLNGKMAYPGLVYLDADLNVIKVSSGYKNPKELLLEMEIVTRS